MEEVQKMLCRTMQLKLGKTSNEKIMAISTDISKIELSNLIDYFSVLTTAGGEAFRVWHHSKLLLF